MHCFWALQDALCRSCWHALCRVAPGACISNTALHRLSVAVEQSDSARQRRREARTRLEQKQQEQLVLEMQVWGTHSML